MPESRQEPEEIPLLSIDEAVAEVRRWLEVEHVDPERVFAASGEAVIRYKDLIAHLQAESPDGKLLRLAISRGRVMKQSRRQEMEKLLEISRQPPHDPHAKD